MIQSPVALTQTGIMPIPQTDAAGVKSVWGIGNLLTDRLLDGGDHGTFIRSLVAKQAEWL